MGNIETSADSLDRRDARALREPLPAEQVQAFARWMDEALQKLEEQFRGWIVPKPAASHRVSRR